MKKKLDIKAPFIVTVILQKYIWDPFPNYKEVQQKAGCNCKLI